MKHSDVVGFEAGLQAGMHICKASNRAKQAFQKALHEVSVYFLVGMLSDLHILQSVYNLCCCMLMCLPWFH